MSLRLHFYSLVCFISIWLLTVMFLLEYLQKNRGDEDRCKTPIHLSNAAALIREDVSNNKSKPFRDSIARFTNKQYIAPADTEEEGIAAFRDSIARVKQYIAPPDTEEEGFAADHPLDQEEGIAADTPHNIPVLWLTHIDTGPKGNTNGITQETLNFVIPLSKYVRLGWANKNERGGKAPAGIKKTIDKLASEARNLAEVTPKIVVLQFAPPRWGRNDEFVEYIKPTDYIVGRAIFETDALQDSWVTTINKNVEEVWAPTNFSRQVFRREGVKSKISIIGEGFDPQIFNPETAVVNKGLHKCCKEGDFIFLGVGKLETRKGWSDLVEAYKHAFTSTSGEEFNVCLTISSKGAKKISDIVGGNYKGPPICLNENLALQQYVSLLKSADVFALATHGEGWGRPIMEAMALGTPVIVPYWGGLTEFVNKNNSMVVEVEELEDAFKKEPSFIGGEEFVGKHHWAKIDSQRFGDKMKWAYENQDEVKKLGEIAARSMRAHWTRDIVASSVFDRVKEIVESEFFASVRRLKQLEKEVTESNGFLKKIVYEESAGSLLSDISKKRITTWFDRAIEITKSSNDILGGVNNYSSRYGSGIVKTKQNIKRIVERRGTFQEEDVLRSSRIVMIKYEKLIEELDRYLFTFHKDTSSLEVLCG